MDKIYSYAEIGDGTNLIAPLYVASVAVNNSYVEAIGKALEKINFRRISWSSLTKYQFACYKIQQEAIKKSELAFTIDVSSIELYKLERYGAEISAYRKIILSSTKVKSILLTKGYNNIIFAPTYVSSSVNKIGVSRKGFEEVASAQQPQFKLAMLHCKLFRIKDLIIYSSLYPNLDVLSHRGKTSRGHIESLSKLKLLPYFYIRDQAYYSFLEALRRYDLEIPNWFINIHKEMQNEGVCFVRNSSRVEFYEED